MTVTFSIEANHTGAFTATCFQTKEVLTGANYDEILLAVTAHKMACRECDMYGIFSRAVMDVQGDDLNLSNTNAIVLLSALQIEVERDEHGYVIDLAGSIEADDLIGRILIASALMDDSGVAPVTFLARGTEGCTITEMGVPAGYYAERFAGLHALATEASRLGRTVTWC